MDAYLFLKISNILFHIVCGSACVGILLLIPFALDVLLIAISDLDIFHTIGEIIAVLLFICVIGVLVPSLILLFIGCLGFLLS